MRLIDFAQRARRAFAHASACYAHPFQWARGPCGVGRDFKGPTVNIQFALAPIIALLAGILILVRPRLLNYIVAIYLIVVGILGLIGRG